MPNFRPRVFPLFLAAALCLAAPPLFADSHGCGAMGGHGEYSEYRAKHMAERHEKLHAALKLNAEQETAWKKFMEAEKPMAKDAAAKGKDGSKLTAPERADQMLDWMKEHQSRMTEHVAALKEFYAILTAAQKKTFDEFHSTVHGKMGGKSGHHPMTGDKAGSKP